MLKLYNIFLFIVLFSTSSFSQENNKDTCNITDTCSYGLGDIKYSILEPACFYRVNNHVPNEWVLVDGRDISNSKLFQLGVTKIPDARGMFIRSMDMGRDTLDNKGDPDWKTRNLVDFQKDTIQSHKHYLAIYSNSNKNEQAQAGRGGGTQMTDYGSVSTTSTGVSETRPKNIALYIYIKIN